MAPLARELMTPVAVTVRSTTPFLQIVRLFVEARISGAAVIDEHGKICGVVSATDLLAALDQAADEDVDEGESEDPLDRLQHITALELASPEVVWVSPDSTASEVARRMHAEGIHRVLVGSEDQPVGMLTTFDLLRAIST